RKLRHSPDVRLWQCANGDNTDNCPCCEPAISRGPQPKTSDLEACGIGNWLDSSGALEKASITAGSKWALPRMIPSTKHGVKQRINCWGRCRTKSWRSVWDARSVRSGAVAHPRAFILSILRSGNGDRRTTRFWEPGQMSRLP